MVIPSKVVIVAGTYDGVLAGWESDDNDNDSFSLALTMATPVHQGSVRALANSGGGSGTLVSCGYDEMLRTHDWVKRVNSAGEVRTPAGLGTPVCASFALHTHCLVGFSDNGKLAVYKKRDWSVQHVLAGHEGGVSSLAVHPTGKLALTGGTTDGRLKLWDLTKGRLAFATRVVKNKNAIVSVVWNEEGTVYGLAHGSHVTVREVATGEILLDTEVPGRINQMTLLEGPEGLFVVAACNDGSIPVLSVDTHRAILAIEPVEGPVAGEERFKCIHALRHGYHVVTANSAGVISVLDLRGAINMILTDNEESDENEEGGDEEGEEELAVDFLASVRLGTGARITCLTAWCLEEDKKKSDQEEEKAPVTQEPDNKQGTKRKGDPKTVEMDAAAVEKARELVKEAKEIQKRKRKKKKR